MSTSLANTLRDIRTEGKAVEWEEQLKFSEIQLKPIVINAKSQSLKPFSVQNFYHSIDLNALSSVTLYTNVNCVEYNEFQRWASAVFELTTEIPESDFHFDFEECNICLKSKYFDVILVQLHARNGFHCVTSEH